MLEEGFEYISAAFISAANDLAKESAIQVQLDYKIMNDAADIQGFKYLFNENDVDSQTYRKILKLKRLCKFLAEEE